MTVLSQIWQYPIKSCAGVSLQECQLTARGLAGDRQLMVVDEDGRFLTQRTCPRLALVTPQLRGRLLTLQAPEMPQLELSISAEGAAMRAVVWDDTVDAVCQGRAAAEWFSEFLNRDVWLVAMHAESRRAVDRNYACHADDVVSFADGFPLLLVSGASLQLLNSRLSQPVSMRRFRPNLVVDGCLPHDEETWRDVRIGDVPLRIVKPCARCVVITVDPDTGIADPAEPTRTLAEYRRFPGGIMFGVNAIGLSVGSTFRVGAEVAVDSLQPGGWME